MTKIRVLAVARLCNPEWSSVPFVGWNHVRALGDVADVHLVTHWENRESIERSDWPRDRVTYIEPSWLDRLFFFVQRTIFRHQYGKVALTAFTIPFYWAFERATWKSFAARLAAGDFDVVHRLTPVSPVLAGSLAKRCASAGIPFVLGPINGGLPWPKGYPTAAGKERESLTRLRFLYHALPFVAGTRRAARAIVVASRNTWTQVPAKYRDKLLYVPENAIFAAQVSPPRAAPAERPLRVAFLGRLVPYKCCDLVIKALAPYLRDGRALLDVIGDGSERPFLEALARSLQVEKAVRFTGELKHGAALARLGENALFAFPSIREFGGAVVVEAMARGVVPIVVDYGGPGEIVAPGTGFVLPLTDEADTTRRLAAVFESALEDPAALVPIAAAARAHVLAEWTWEAKAAKSLAIYAHVLGRTARPPLSPPSGQGLPG